MNPLSGLGTLIHRAVLVVLVAAMGVATLSLVAFALATWLGLRVPLVSVVVVVIVVLVWAASSQHSAETKAAAPPLPPQGLHRPMPRAGWDDLKAAAELKTQGHITQEQFDALLASVVPGEPVLPPRHRR
jgi:hypothetical protein